VKFQQVLVQTELYRQELPVSNFTHFPLFTPLHPHSSSLSLIHHHPQNFYFPQSIILLNSFPIIDFVSKIYPHTRQHAYRYKFISDGKERIEKIALFDPTPVDNLFNFAFGDLLKDGTIDIYANSNNGDVIKVFATVIQIIKLFTNENPSATVFFSGSTPRRTALYQRILKTYYDSITNEFIINALVKRENRLIQVRFSPLSPEQFLGFYIQRFQLTLPYAFN
jgi:hypothetical protein